MSTDADLIAAFLAKKSITKIATGERSMSEREMREATGYEPETQKVFFAHGWDECGTAIVRRINAKSASHAEMKIHKFYHEMRLSHVSRENPANNLERLEDLK